MMRLFGRMTINQCPSRFVAAFALAAFCLMLVVPMASAHADTGAVYSCTIVPCYRHPVTNEIEDAGGEAGYATGLGMVQSCIFSEGMMEVTDAGAYYLTIRLGLLDYSSGHTFQVQEWGAMGWSDPRLGVTNTGSDSSGTTEDVCIEVPSQKCIVRVTMYVEPMGRNVICYCYPKDFVAGQPNDMNATMVTAGSAASASGEDGASGDGLVADDGEAFDVPPSDDAPEDAAVGTSAELESVDDSAAGEANEDDLTGQAVSQAQGLTLSTALTTSMTIGEAPSIDLPENVVTALVAAASAACVFALGLFTVLFAFRRRVFAIDPDDYSALYGDADV